MSASLSGRSTLLVSCTTSKGRRPVSRSGRSDWQLWLLANLYGFIARDTGIRRFRQASVFVPKGNGKSLTAAVLALYTTVLEEEGGAEGYSAAVSREQAENCV